MSEHEQVFESLPKRAIRVAQWLAPLLVLAVLATGIWYFTRDDVDGSSQTFHILTESENRALFENPNSDEPSIMEQFAEEENIELVPTYQGSVDSMIDLQHGAEQYDAVWPASSLWINLGDSQHAVSRTQSIMGSPVVFGVKRSKAEQLGWIGKDVSVDDILTASEQGDLDFLMSSATQSNSGAMAYLGYLYAFAGHPQVLTGEMLRDPEVVDKLTRILGSVDRTAGASGYLSDLFLESYADYDGMVNNESAIIDANHQLAAQGETDLLYVIYPVDGLAIADWPLGFVDHGDAEKSEIFDRLQTYLRSDEVRQQLVGMGRRTLEMGPQMDPAEVDPAVFNPGWGIDVARPLDPIALPAADVVVEALDLYQTAFRKPSFVVFCLDFSSSMSARGEPELKEAMTTLLDQELASSYYLQRTAQDVTVVLPFSTGVMEPMRTDGNNEDELLALSEQVNQTVADGGTNIYACLTEALAQLASRPDGHAAAIVLMTDGQSNRGSFEDFAKHLPTESGEIVPVYSILFGDASKDQLEEISEATSGAIYDGREGLIAAMRDAFANA